MQTINVLEMILAVYQFFIIRYSEGKTKHPTGHQQTTSGEKICENV